MIGFIKKLFVKTRLKQNVQVGSIKEAREEYEKLERLYHDRGRTIIGMTKINVQNQKDILKHKEYQKQYELASVCYYESAISYNDAIDYLINKAPKDKRKKLMKKVKKILT